MKYMDVYTDYVYESNAPMFVCVDKEYQGKGYTRYLVEAAKKYVKKENVPLLFDTDIEEYAQIYQHVGCELYNQTLADNGVTRYNIMWKMDD